MATSAVEFFFGSDLLATGIVVFAGCCAVLVAARPFSCLRSAASVPQNFITFQQNYLFVVLLCNFSDWLKGPYSYALYKSFNFDQWHIAFLFSTGYASSLLFGTVVGSLSDKFGRRYTCQVFCIVFILSAVTKVHDSFFVQIVGRILSGVAASILHTVFETWMIHEHRRRKFSEDLIADTFSKHTLGNGIAAITAGLAAQFFSRFGYCVPFVVAVPFLVLACLKIRAWEENYGDRKTSNGKTMLKAVNLVIRFPTLRWLGMCQSTFEAAMFLWVFYWTPALESIDYPTAPLGLLFAVFMVSLMVGSSIVHLIKWENAALIVHLTSLLSMTAIYALYATKNVVLIFCVLFETAVGGYYPLHGSLRAEFIPDTCRSTVTNLFRFLMNTIVVSVLWFAPPTRTAFLILAVLHFVSLMSFIKFMVNR